jgi:nucleotidyltransferase/DNA polymerase involved in DNA repair
VPENVARVALNKIWGVGPVTAAQMIRAGLRTIHDVRKAVQEESYPFSFQQKIGIRHYEDFQVRVVYPECAVGGRQSA